MIGKRTPIVRKSTPSESSYIHLTVVIIEGLIPFFRAIDFVVNGCDINKAFGSNAGFVIGHTDSLAISLLRLLYGHTEWKTEVNMQFLAGRIFHVQQLAAPTSRLCVKFACRCDSFLYDRCVVYIESCLKSERFRQ